jgi:hypothetical protein
MFGWGGSSGKSVSTAVISQAGNFGKFPGLLLKGVVRARVAGFAVVLFLFLDDSLVAVRIWSETERWASPDSLIIHKNI